ncbi:hypothetical protein [Longispora albida]|uniref:hypothetical protein n=1 Tax=Longispora albida TaxID=203523 RepID=UPI000360E051|nr:hypothetical protein [Longispora albida]
MTDLRLKIGAGVAVAATIALLALPAPATPEVRSPAGPVTLAAAWPKAVTGQIPAVQPDGQTYNPSMLFAKGSAGMLAPDNKAPSFVLRIGDTFRELVPAGQLSSVDATALTEAEIFWLRSNTDDQGKVKYAIWAAALTGGAPREVTADTGSPLLFGSAWDFQVANGRLHWVSSVPDTTTVTEFRSVALTGGPVTAKRLPGSLALSEWPWATTGPVAPGTPIEVVNVETEARRTIPAAAQQGLTCGPVWCRAMTPVPGGTALELRKLDGSEPRRIGGDDAQPVGFAVAALERFEFYTTPGTSNATGVTLRLWLYDVKTGRTVQVAADTYSIMHRDGYLLWSTGDHETLAWHFLDLRSLG